jgi:hypothetical protein
VSSRTSWLDTISQIFHLIPDLATPEQVEASLREILEDPTLELFWWDWQREVYVDVHGEDRGAVVTAAGQIVTVVDYETRKVGAVAHDERLLATPEFLQSFVPMMRIAMERDRLHRDLIEKLEELKASRLRLVKIADEERRRLERNLHDGAQQRLTVALLALRRCSSSSKGMRSWLGSRIRRRRSSRQRSRTSASSRAGSIRRSWRSTGWREQSAPEPRVRRFRSSSISKSGPSSHPSSRPPRTTSALRRSRTPSSTPARRRCGSASSTRERC